MTDEHQGYDLRAIDPIAPAPESDEAEEQQQRADRVGFVASAAAGSPPAVGVAAERIDEAPESSDEGAADTDTDTGEASSQSR
jgi:hypothetical protein